MKTNDDIKLNIEERISSSKVLGIYDIADESKVRVVVENAAGGNTVLVKGRIKGQAEFELIKILTGSISQAINVFTYDEIQIECSVYSSSSDFVKILAASFNQAGGSAIDSIGVASGDNLTDIENFSFISSDSSISIVGDNVAKTINLTTAGGSSSAYAPADPSDWSPAPTIISEALDQLADRVNTIEDEVGQPNGIASLDSSGKVPSSQLPSYVDDVIEVANFASLPPVGETGKIYITLDTNKTYRWSGSVYVEISSSPENVAISFNATTDWTLVSDEYILTIPASTHLKGINPQVQVYEVDGSDFANVIIYTAINASGNITLAVPQTPDTRFTGKVIIS